MVVVSVTLKRIILHIISVVGKSPHGSHTFSSFLTLSLRKNILQPNMKSLSQKHYIFHQNKSIFDEASNLVIFIGSVYVVYWYFYIENKYAPFRKEL